MSPAHVDTPTRDFNYELRSCKGMRKYRGTEAGALRAAQAMDDELDPVYGVRVWRIDETARALGPGSSHTLIEAVPVADVESGVVTRIEDDESEWTPEDAINAVCKLLPPDAECEVL